MRFLNDKKVESYVTYMIVHYGDIRRFKQNYAEPKPISPACYTLTNDECIRIVASGKQSLPTPAGYRRDHVFA